MVIEADVLKMLSHRPRPQENDDKDERNGLEDQISRVELLDSRLDLFLRGVMGGKVLTHLDREAELSVAMDGSAHLLGKGVVPKEGTSSGACLGQDEVP